MWSDSLADASESLAHDVRHFGSAKLPGAQQVDELGNPGMSAWRQCLQNMLENQLHDLLCSGESATGQAEVMQAVADATARCRFESTDVVSDHVTLFKILQVCLAGTCLSKRDRSAA